MTLLALNVKSASRLLSSLGLGTFYESHCPTRQSRTRSMLIKALLLSEQDVVCCFLYGFLNLFIGMGRLLSSKKKTTNGCVGISSAIITMRISKTI